MQMFEPYSAIVAALKESKFVDLIEKDGQEFVNRKKAYVSDSEWSKKRVAQSVYIKGFGEEEIDTQLKIENWLSNYGALERVKLRREGGNRGPFKGSVYAEFKSVELAQQFVKLSPPPTWNGQELKIMMKVDYLDEKTRQIRAGEIEPSKNHHTSFFEGREKGSRGRGGRGRGGQGGNGDKDNWKKRRDNDQKNGFRGGRGGRGFRGRGRGGGGRGRGGRDRDNDRGNNTPKTGNK